MAEDDSYFRLRIPQELKENLRQAAEQAGRSMNAEILFRLSETFEQVYINDDFEARLDALEDRMWDVLYTLGDGLKYRPDKQGR
ncbi:MAG: Arc family DNA-binding protein [Novosphingobium sp.]